MDNLPVCNKCCFCVPLRYGLLTWGYLKLATLLVGLTVYIALTVVLSGFLILRRDLPVIIIIALVGFLLTIEIIFHIIFVIGAHRKIVKLLNVYYYYALSMWVITIIMSVVGTVFLIQHYNIESRKEQAICISISIITFIISIVIQTFLILSVRSEIIKLRSNCPYRFVRDENHPDGTIHSATMIQEASMDTARIL